MVLRDGTKAVISDLNLSITDQTIFHTIFISPCHKLLVAIAYPPLCHLSPTHMAATSTQHEHLLRAVTPQETTM